MFYLLWESLLSGKTKKLVKADQSKLIIITQNNKTRNDGKKIRFEFTECYYNVLKVRALAI